MVSLAGRYPLPNLSAGFYSWRALGEDEDGRLPRIQILTIEELLAGKGIDYPPSQHRTFKVAPKAGVKDRYGEVQHESCSTIPAQTDPLPDRVRS